MSGDSSFGQSVKVPCSIWSSQALICVLYSGASGQPSKFRKPGFCDNTCAKPPATGSEQAKLEVLGVRSDPSAKRPPVPFSGRNPIKTVRAVLDAPGLAEIL